MGYEHLLKKKEKYATELKTMPQGTEEEKAAHLGKRRTIKELDYEIGMIKKRYLGNINFIGELYKESLLTERIMKECINQLLKPNYEIYELLSKGGKKSKKSKDASAAASTQNNATPTAQTDNTKTTDTT